MHQLGRYSEISPNTVQDLSAKLPADLGVYVVRMRQQPVNPCDKIVYVGMIGKFVYPYKFSQARSLRDIVNRIVPYSFDKINNPHLFEFGPNAKSPEGLAQLNPGARYSNSIALADLVFDCFTVGRQGFDAPAFLEAAILQAYLLEFKRLPAANNAF